MVTIVRPKITDLEEKMNTNFAKYGEVTTTRKSSSGFSCPQFPMGCPAIQHRPSSRHRWRWHSLKASLRLQKMVAGGGKIVEIFSLFLWYCTSSCGELPRTSVITPATMIAWPKRISFFFNPIRFCQRVFTKSAASLNAVMAVFSFTVVLVEAQCKAF